MENIWNTIEDFPSYEISNLGMIRNKKTGKIKSIYVGKRGYPVVSLRKDGKTYLKTIHRLLAQVFIPNPNNLPEVNHINGIKTDYSLANLEWVTTRENNIHARLTGLHISDGDKEVIQLDKLGNIIRKYKSVSEASRITGIRRSTINAVLHKYKNDRGYIYKTAGNYIWRYNKNEL